MKKFSLVFTVAVLGLFLVVGNASAALLGVTPGLPDILSNSTGVYSYVADTNLISFSAQAHGITFDRISTIPIVGGTYSANFLVDNAGNFAGGVDGNDLEIYGSFTYNSINYSGLLIAGEVNNFGWLDTGVGSIFDYTFNPTGGALLSYYANGLGYGGDIAFVESSNFSGVWTTNHNGTPVKHDTAAHPGTPEPSSLMLLGMGILGLFGLGKKRA